MMRRPALTMRARSLIALTTLWVAGGVSCRPAQLQEGYTFAPGAPHDPNDHTHDVKPAPPSCAPAKLSRTALATDPAIAMDGENYPVVSWTEAGSSQSQVFARYYDGLTWRGLAESDRGDGVSLTGGSGSAMEVDSQGSLVVAWNVENRVSASVVSYGVMIRRFRGSRWESVDDAGVYPGIINRDVNQPGHLGVMVMPPDDSPLVAFDASNTWDKSHNAYVLWDFPGVGWAGVMNPPNEPVVANTSLVGVSRRPEGMVMASLASGQVSLTFLSQDPNKTPDKVTGDPGNTVQRLPNRLGTHVSDASLATDSGGMAWVAYSDDRSGNAEIYLAKWTGVAWAGVSGAAGGDNISNTPTPSRRPALSLDQNDHPRVAWDEAASDNGPPVALRLRVWDGHVWQAPAGFGGEQGISDKAGRTVQGPRIVSGIDGRAALAWESGDGVYACVFAPGTREPVK